MARRRTIFVCYSHKDEKWLERLRTSLAPLTDHQRLDLWHDQRIKPGADWHKEIDSALSSANAAVLLVTQDFFNSEFIRKKELPAILQRRKREGLPLIWIPVSATNYEMTELNDIQAAYNTSHPLDTLTASRRNQALVAIVKRISEATTTTAVGDVMRTADAITPAILAQEPGILARQRDGRVEFHFRDGPVTETIDPPDLGDLTEPERQLIITYQASMASAYARWLELYPRRDSLTKVELARLRRARRQMCDDLGKVLDFLDSIHRYPPDHYRIVRVECGKLQHSRR